jgi:hypothetical protein
VTRGPTSNTCNPGNVRVPFDRQHFDGDALASGRPTIAEHSSVEACTKISLSPRSAAMKPNRLVALYLLHHAKLFTGSPIGPG